MTQADKGEIIPTPTTVPSTAEPDADHPAPAGAASNANVASTNNQLLPGMTLDQLLDQLGQLVRE